MPNGFIPHIFGGDILSNPIWLPLFFLLSRGWSIKQKLTEAEVEKKSKLKEETGTLNKQLELNEQQVLNLKNNVKEDHHQQWLSTQACDTRLENKGTETNFEQATKKLVGNVSIQELQAALQNINTNEENGVLQV